MLSLESLTSSTFRLTNQRLKGFQDWKRVRIISGDGGDGAISFEKSAKVLFGPPNGGNGGTGGSVYVKASRSVTCLNSLHGLYRAKNGDCGRRMNLHGAAAESIDIVVPVGTTIRQVKSSVDSIVRDYTRGKDDSRTLEEKLEMDRTVVERYFKLRSKYSPKDDRIQFLLKRLPLPFPEPEPIQLDLTEEGERHLLLRGGRSGKGNPHFVSHDIRGPPFALRGESGREIVLEFELKSLADAGLVGLPNAGKSSFLAAVSQAHPKIAPYPFTTLNPYVATIDYPDYYSFTLADIPGIIPGISYESSTLGASTGAGLGHSFLRHIERSKILVYVVDLSGVEPWSDLRTLKHELESFKVGLSEKRSMVIANKAEMKGAKENLIELSRQFCNDVIVPLSAKNMINIELATDLMRRLNDKEL